MNGISAYHWSLAFLGALFFHVAIAAAWLEQEPPKTERLAGTPVVIVGALASFADQKAVEETVVEEIEPVEQVVEGKQEIKTAVAALEAEPTETVEDALMPQMIPEKTVVEPVKDKQKKKPKKKAKKDKHKQKRVKASKKMAALKKGGGAKGRQKKTAGRAVIANYRGRVQSHLARYKRSPGGGAKGRVTVSFTITRSGSVVGVKLVRGSGNKAVDRATLSMVRRASPFPPIPSGGPARMRFSVPINYR